MRLVLDTNVVLPALVFGRRLQLLREAWKNGLVRPLSCRETLDELTRALGYRKFGLSEGERRLLLAEYLGFVESMTLPEPPPPVPECRDRSDLIFFQLAVAGRADALVSGDRDVAVLATVSPVPLLNVAALKVRLSPP